MRTDQYRFKSMLLNNLPVLTSNVADFTDIDGLRVSALADVLTA